MSIETFKRTFQFFKITAFHKRLADKTIMWGISIAWSSMRGLGPCDPGSNPGFPVFLFNNTKLINGQKISYVLKNKGI